MSVAHGPCEWVLPGNDYSCHHKLCMDLWHNGVYKVGEFLVVVYEDFLFYFHSVLPHDCFNFRQHVYHSESIQVSVDRMFCFLGYHDACNSLSREWCSRGDDSSCDLQFGVDVWHQSMYKADQFFVVVYDNIWVHFPSNLPYGYFNCRQSLSHTG